MLQQYANKKLKKLYLKAIQYEDKNTIPPYLLPPLTECVRTRNHITAEMYDLRKGDGAVPI